MAERGQRLAHLARGRGVEWVLLRLHRPTAAGIRAKGRYALCHKPPHPHRVAGGEKVIRALGPQAVGQRGIAFRVALHACKGSELMNDHVRPHAPHRLRHLIRIKRVRHHRHSTEPPQHWLLGLAARHAVNLMTGGDQARHELAANRSRRACHKHSHRWAP